VLAAEMLKHDGEGIASRLGRPLTHLDPKTPSGS